jgi:hypothetical protein
MLLLLLWLFWLFPMLEVLLPLLLHLPLSSFSFWLSFSIYI